MFYSFLVTRSEYARNPPSQSSQSCCLSHTRKHLVQSLNSPFFPPHMGAQPGRAKEDSRDSRDSRITCMGMLRTTPFFPPNRGKNIFGSTFQIWLMARFSEWQHTSTNFLHLDWLKTCQLIPNQWNFTDSDLTVHALHYANELLVRVRLSFKKTFAKSLNVQKQYQKNVWERVTTRTRCR